MDAAARHPHLAFFREYLGDLTKRSITSAQLLDKITVRLEPGAGRFVRQRVQDFLQFVVHDWTRIAHRSIIKRNREIALTDT